MSNLKRRLERLQQRLEDPFELGDPPHTWEDLYKRMCNHVPRKRLAAPAKPMSPAEAYAAMTNGKRNPDEPRTPEESWKRYLEKFG